MRLVLVFSIGFFVFLATFAFAQDVILGNVVSVDREKGSFVVQIDDPKGTPPELVSIVGGKDNDPLFLPDCVQIGESVRVWGQYRSGDKPSFAAEVVRGPGHGRYDKSGVRSRLNRGPGKQYGRQYGRQSGHSRNRK